MKLPGWTIVRVVLFVFVVEQVQESADLTHFPIKVIDPFASLLTIYFAPFAVLHCAFRSFASSAFRVIVLLDVRLVYVIYVAFA